MPTATKNARTKVKKVVKTEPKNEEETSLEEAENEFEPVPTKNKKPIEIEEVEPAIIGDEKVEEDPLLGTTEDDELGTDEISLDTEELNPFGDRWEE